jgi:hypothetical membrane protein
VKHVQIAVSRQSTWRRFLFPGLLVFAIWLVTSGLYGTAWKFLPPGTLPFVAWTCGLGGALYRILLAPLIVYPIAYPRGASLLERMVICVIPMAGWSAEQLYLASGVFSVGETVYYAFSSGFMLLLSCLFMEMGVCEMLFRFRYGKQGQQKNTRYLGPAIAVAAGMAGIFILLFWEGGTRWFYYYQEGYKLLFHT